MTNQLKPTVLQILNRPNKRGGIQAVAKVLTEIFSRNGIDCVNTSMKLTSIFNQLIFRRRMLPNIVVIHGMSNLVTFRALIYLLFRRLTLCKPAKTVWQVHYHPFRHHRFPLISKLYFYSINFALAFISDILVAITPDEKKHLEKLVKSSKIRIIPNPLRSFTDDINIAGDFSQKAESKLDPYVLTIGRNDHNKNIATLHALRNLIKAAGYKIKIVTNNKNNIHPDCEVYLNCTDHELNNLITNAECIIIPSKYEAFSLVAIESIARGTPIISGPNVGALSFDCVRKGAVVTDFTETSFLNALKEIKFFKYDLNKLSSEVRASFSEKKYCDIWFELIKYE